MFNEQDINKFENYDVVVRLLLSHNLLQPLLPVRDDPEVLPI